MTDTERRPEPGEVYEWTDANDLNQFQCRRLPDGKYLVIAGHGPRGPQRRYSSVVLPAEVASDFAAALVESLAGVT